MRIEVAVVGEFQQTLFSVYRAQTFFTVRPISAYFIPTFLYVRMFLSMCIHDCIVAPPVCVCVCVYFVQVVYIYACMPCMYVCDWVSMNVCVHVYVFAYIVLLCIYMYMHMGVYMSMSVQLYV